ncbi:hypothetical protein AB0H36_27500 [Kribbella sp. NPDC050820]|uniref:hypothetical protein n=1 Tax=Kribbella sp. NPDC050820 TaxID=3155408 RepID=UPI0033C088A9
MNRYGATARNYFRDYLPTRYSQIEDPEEFFQVLGQQIQDQIVDLTPQLAGEDPAGESYLEKVGRLNAAGKQAEELVMADLVYSQTPENDSEELPEETANHYGDLHETIQSIHDLTSSALTEPQEPQEPEIPEDPPTSSR